MIIFQVLFQKKYFFTIKINILYNYEQEYYIVSPDGVAFDILCNAYEYSI